MAHCFLPRYDFKPLSSVNRPRECIPIVTNPVPPRLPTRSTRLPARSSIKQKTQETEKASLEGSTLRRCTMERWTCLRLCCASPIHQSQKGACAHSDSRAYARSMPARVETLCVAQNGTGGEGMVKARNRYEVYPLVDVIVIVQANVTHSGFANTDLIRSQCPCWQSKGVDKSRIHAQNACSAEHLCTMRTTYNTYSCTCFRMHEYTSTHRHKCQQKRAQT